MTIALLLRDGPPAQMVASRLSAVTLPALIVLETGRNARRRKRRRMLMKGLPWRLPLTMLDLVANWAYQRAWQRYLKKRIVRELHGSAYPGGVPVLRVDDVNDPPVRQALEETSPDVTVVFGTSILRTPTLAATPGYTINIHGGIVPQYRNVHSEAWAILNNDRNNVGVSVIHLDEGIDTGAVALQRRLSREPVESFFDIRFRNLILAADTAAEALMLAQGGRMPVQPQAQEGWGFYPTPGAATWIRLWWKTRQAPHGLASSR